MGLNLFGQTFTVLSKVLDLRSQRHTLISSNIANVDTPRYKSKQLKFEEELKKFDHNGGKLNLKQTDKNHLPSKFDINTITPVVVENDSQSIRADGNTVDIDREFVKMSRNQLMYNTIAQIIGKKFKGMLSVIKETR